MKSNMHISLSAGKTSAAIAAGFACAWFACLVVMLRQHAWIVDQSGHPIVIDFLEVWVAGRTVLTSAASATYDPALHHAAQVAAAGHEFRGFLGWHYPPLYLFVAAGLGALPYSSAFLVWVAGTVAGFAASIAAIARSRMAAPIACAMPVVFINAVTGQNGCLTASLIGATLVTLERAPILSGALLGLLTYKPQFGILFPIVFAISGRWRAIAAATVVAGFAIVLPWAAFGADAFHAFLHFLPRTGDAVLVHGTVGWNKLQSIYGVARWLGCTNLSASVLQGGVGLAAAAALVWLWRRHDVPFERKAAALATAILLATPYLYMYDYAVLAVPIAFLFREQTFDRFELAAIGAANLLLLAFYVFAVPVGPLAAAVVIVMIARRLARETATSLPNLAVQAV